MSKAAYACYSTLMCRWVSFELCALLHATFIDMPTLQCLSECCNVYLFALASACASHKMHMHA